MEEIIVQFDGKEYPFNFYASAIVDLVYFVQTKDPEAIDIMGKDHFFITKSFNVGSEYQFDLNGPNPDEGRFKLAVANKIADKGF